MRPREVERILGKETLRERNAAGARFALGLPEAAEENRSLQMWLGLLRSNRVDRVFISEDFEVSSGLSLPLMTTRDIFLSW